MASAQIPTQLSLAQAQEAEQREIAALYAGLLEQPMVPFPPAGKRPSEPRGQGVYILRDPTGVGMHVGRNKKRADGLRGRLCDHLDCKSSFTNNHLDGKASLLRGGYTYQCIEVPKNRTRALLEAFAIGALCPVYLDGKQSE